MSPRLCAISVDLDEIPNYYGIHGLPLDAPGGNGPSAPSASPGSITTVYDVAVPRLTALASGLGLPLTFFAIGGDLSRGASARSLARAVAAGHAVGNHTMSHLYDLTRRDRATIAREIEEASVAIERACGVRPRGFRAPGYTITDDVFVLLRGLGFAYDSSVFPSPAYWAAKGVAITAYGLLGRTSRSVVDTPSMLTAPTRPYRVGRPYWRRGDGLLELPIQVTRALRLPFIGTSLVLAKPSVVRWLTRGVVGEPLVNLELHGIDLLDENDPGLARLAPHQPDVRVPLARKEQALGVVVEVLRSAGYAFVTLDEAAEAF